MRSRRIFRAGFILTLIAVLLFQISVGQSGDLFERVPGAVRRDEAAVTVSAKSPMQEFLKRLTGKKPPAELQERKRESVYLGGMPVGITLRSKGVIVLGIGGVQTENGPVKPFEGLGLKEGDIITEIDGAEITCVDDINTVINLPEKAGQAVTVTLVRKNKSLAVKTVPALDKATGKYKLGLWIRDNAAGVGTITYIRKDRRFGALGHPICDADVGGIMPICGGNAYKCEIVGVVKGKPRNPGELRGLFLRARNRIGTLEKNNGFGVFGTLGEIIENPLYPEPVECAFRSEVKPGAATILSTTGETIQEYSIEIIKTSYQNSAKEKSMVIKVTDPRLLNQTAGIVQGMSGSPILQNGRLIGAVTHVFINDPTKGFGVYIDWMLGQ